MPNGAPVEMLHLLFISARLRLGIRHLPVTPAPSMMLEFLELFYGGRKDASKDGCNLP